MKTASLVLGILGLVFCWIPGVGFVMAVLALVMGAVKIKSGMGIAGFVLGVIGVVAFLCMLIAIFNR